MTRGRRKPPKQVETPVSGYTPELGERLSSAIQMLGGPFAASRATGVSTDALAKWRTGASSPSFYGVIGLANAARIRLDWISTGEGPMRLAEAPASEAVDEALMRDCIVVVEELLEEFGKRLAPEDKADLILNVYRLEQLERNDGKPGLAGAEIIRLVRRAS